MSAGFAVGMIVLALNVGFLAGAWWGGRMRDAEDGCKD